MEFDRLEGKETKGTKAQRKMEASHAWGREGQELSWSNMHHGGRSLRAWKAGWEKTRHKIGCRWAGSWACEKRKPSTKENWGWSQ